MSFDISKHATDQMKLRGVSEDLVWHILNSTDQIISSTEKSVYQSIIIEDGSNF